MVYLLDVILPHGFGKERQWQVQPLSGVDNSDCSPNRLTVQ
jgi:hypothetical protein